MLPLSKITISLKPSTNYRRFIVLALGFAEYMVSQSALPSWAMVGLFILVLFYGLWLWHQKATYIQIHYNDRQWQLTHKNGQITSFDAHSVLYHTGLFLVLAFYKEKKRRLVLLFTDELSKGERQFLKRIENIH